MKITLIILNYNQFNYLRLILNKLVGFVRKYNIEIIITDDGSNYNEIKNIIKEISNIDLSIYFIFQQDLGFRAAKARNNAIKLANGNLIITLDSDCIPNENFIDEHLKVHNNNDHCLVYADREHGFLRNNKIFIDKDVGIREKNIKSNMLIWQRAWSFNISFLKDNSTFFDENFIGYGLEDTEFAYRLFKKNNFKIIEIDNPLVVHLDNDLLKRSSSPFVSRKAEHIFNYINNAIYFYEKYIDDEILQTMSNIPNFDEFINPNFDFRTKINNKEKQTIDNLKKQVILYKNYINNKNDSIC